MHLVFCTTLLNNVILFHSEPLNRFLTQIYKKKKMKKKTILCVGIEIMIKQKFLIPNCKKIKGSKKYNSNILFLKSQFKKNIYI